MINWLPTLMMYESVVAAAVCAWQGKLPQALYWLCAAGITYAVIWMNR